MQRIFNLHPRVSGLPVAAGHTRGANPPRDDQLQVHMLETFNANLGRDTLKKRLERTSALVLIAQEIGYGADNAEELSSWASRRGWSSIIEPGHPTKGHLPAAGVAVFASERSA